MKREEESTRKHRERLSIGRLAVSGFVGAIVGAILTAIATGGFNIYRGYDSSIDRALSELSASRNQLQAQLLEFNEINLGRQEHSEEKWLALRTSISHVMSAGQNVAVIIPDFDEPLEEYNRSLSDVLVSARSLKNAYEGGEGFLDSIQTYELAHLVFLEEVQEKQSGLSGFWASLR